MDENFKEQESETPENEVEKAREVENEVEKGNQSVNEIEKAGETKNEASGISASKFENLKKKAIPIIKSKAFIIGVAILIYTIVVSGITVKIDRKIIANQIQKSFQQAFNGDDDSSNDIENKVGKEDKKPKKEAKKLSMNQTVTIGDVMELTLESSEWVDEIKPSNTNGVYSYYEDEEGEKYFVIKGKIKNIAGEDLDIQSSNKSKIIVNDTYKATITIEAEETDGTSFYGSIKPLQTLNVIAYGSLSDEAFNICKKIRCDLDILSDSTHINNYYDDETPHESFYIEFDNSIN